MLLGKFLKYKLNFVVFLDVLCGYKIFFVKVWWICEVIVEVFNFDIWFIIFLVF